MDQEFCFVPPQTHDYSDSELKFFLNYFFSLTVPLMEGIWVQETDI